MQTGSTEWVEENREMLSSRAVAYLNVDVSVNGPGLNPSTTPQLDELLRETIKMVCIFSRITYSLRFKI
jgi:N-acetylated-alpha-linked acidic dipeptidase